MSEAKRPPLRGLGRGLDALLPLKSPPRKPSAEAGDGPSYGEGNVFSCPIDKIVPNRGQPRQHFDPERLGELTESIRMHGLIEPLVVRRRAGGDDFEIIAGERRWRAAQQAALREVLVVVRDVSTKDAFELALIENVQREDLDPIEFAQALDRLMKDHGYTHQTLAERLGKDRSTLANALRLLRLPQTVQKLLIAGELSEGHARALLGAPDDATLGELADKVVHGRLTVRRTEQLVRSLKSKGSPARTAENKKSPSVRDLETRLERKLGTRVEIRDRKDKGQIVVTYSSWDELDRILDVIL